MGKTITKAGYKCDLKKDQAVEIEVWQAAEKGDSIWIPATFDSAMVALDRPYRVNVFLPNGIKLTELAPECVRPI